MKHLYLVILTGLFVTTSVTAHAEKIYKWQDDDGSWNYSEVPPVEKEAQTLRIKGPKQLGQPSAKEPEQENTDKSVGQSEDQPLKQSPEVAAAERERKAHNCEVARKNLTSLTNRPRIRYMDEEKGEERYLTPDEHDEWSEKSKNQVKEFCQ